MTTDKHAAATCSSHFMQIMLALKFKSEICFYTCHRSKFIDQGYPKIVIAFINGCQAFKKGKAHHLSVKMPRRHECFESKQNIIGNNKTQNEISKKKSKHTKHKEKN